MSLLNVSRYCSGLQVWARLAFVLVWAGACQMAQARQGFQPEPGSWTAMGTDAHVTPLQAREAGQGAQAALEYRYRVGKGLVSLLVLPLPKGRLEGTDSLRFMARTDHLTSLTLALEEQGGGRWTAAVTLRPDRWHDVQVPYKDLMLAVGGDAPADRNGRLDLDRVQRIAVIDTGAMLSASSPKMMQLFDIEAGDRRLVIANFGIESAPMPSPGERLDGLDRNYLPWSVFGATDAQLAAEAPLREPGLVVDYRKATGKVMSAIRQLAAGSLADNATLELAAASRMKTTLVLKVEQRDGGKFEASVGLPAGGTLQTERLRPADFKRSDDSGTKAGQPEWSKVTNLILMDIGGLFGSSGNNRFWLQGIAATGGDSAATTADAPKNAVVRPAQAAPSERVSQQGWATWSKRSTPIHSGPFSLVGDPSVIRDGAVYRMAYTCFEPKRKGPAICGATSTDGINWADVPAPGPLAGRLIATRPGKWDDTHETPFLLKRDGEYLLYFAGYRNRGGHFKSFPLQIGLARSSDGERFERVSDDPILKVSADGFDSDAVFSPTIVEYAGELVMLYTAYCFDTCKREKGVYLMAATSRNGRDWVKREKPILSKADVKTKDGVAESEVIKGPDGDYYLFMTLLYGGDKGHDIGIARSDSPFGPWQFASESVVRRKAGEFDHIGPIAPSVLIEGDKVRMWFHGFSQRKTIEIGYAESSWPLRTGR